MPVLYIFSGLPGSGKSTLAGMLANRLNCIYLRIDTIEQELRDVGALEVGNEGYRLAYKIAEDNLKIGNSVVADSCNPISLTRREWEDVALKLGRTAVNIEVVCSDPAEHRRRIEEREPDIPGLILPTWEQVLTREYDAWESERIVVDTARASPESSVERLLEQAARAAAGEPPPYRCSVSGDDAGP